MNVCVLCSLSLIMCLDLDLRICIINFVFESGELIR